MADAVRTARAWGADRLFVKVDSTLRGNVLAEVSGALRAWGGADAVATPAFPAQGRTVRDGVLHVDDMPQPAAVGALFPPGVDVRDARDDADLRRLAQRIVQDGSIAVGSAGLAGALAQVLRPAPPSPRRPSAVVSGVLVVVGTGHPASRAQSGLLLDAGTVCLVVRPGIPASLDRPVAELARGGRVLVTTSLEQGVEGDSPRAQLMAAELGQVVHALLTSVPGTALVVTGGSTALAVAQGLGAAALRLLGEVAPGIALGELLVDGHPVPTITKSGGFGPPEALLRAVEFLEECV